MTFSDLVTGDGKPSRLAENIINNPDDWPEKDYLEARDVVVRARHKCARFGGFRCDGRCIRCWNDERTAYMDVYRSQCRCSCFTQKTENK